MKYCGKGAQFYHPIPIIKMSLRITFQEKKKMKESLPGRKLHISIIETAVRSI
jgi:hypothetical protein